ncbi:polysaccharide biosynthesis tyrosine autokinase [Modestobacter caceresii]|uniref:polysaccharide biosynthesis tyrosine autokinase n=1 Tax=Modestobacter caceresii TaxID=1522368 RepID=UPI0006920E6F|nr:polysaccharide biosynthesis tyrosine autokinase [Modestobacter caceresii]
MGLRANIDTARRRWRWVVGLSLAGVLVAAALVSTSAPTYRASASVFFSLDFGGSASDLVQGSTYAQNQVTSFAALATTPAVLQSVVDELDPGSTATALATRVSAQAPTDTVLVEVTATDGSAAGAARIANAVAESLGRQVEALAPTGADGEPNIEATTVTPAEAPASAATPRVVLTLVAGLLVGLLLGIGCAFARETLDNRVRDVAALARVTPLPVLGLIGRRRAGDGRPVVVEAAPLDPQAEFYRQLRTNLGFLEVSAEREPGDRRLSVIAVTSSVPGEGKSTVTANLAAALAEGGARVLLVDADLRRPTQAAMLGLEGAAGLTTVLRGGAELADVVQDWGSSGLQVLASGACPPNPGELLSSPAMGRFLTQQRAAWDFVVIDTPPLLPVADAAILSRLVDGTLVVANARLVRRHQLAEALTGLAQVGAHQLGIVLNMVDREDSAYDYRTDRLPGQARRRPWRRRPRAVPPTAAARHAPPTRVLARDEVPAPRGAPSRSAR